MASMIFLPDGKDTALSRRNPLSKLIALIAISGAALSGPDESVPVILGALIIISYVFSVPIVKRLWEAKAMLLIAVFIGLAEYFQDGDILSSLAESAAFITVLGSATLFTATTDPVELSSSIGSALTHIAGKKAWGFASDIMLTISILPSIFQVSSEMMEARKSRGGRFAAHPIKNLSEYTISLISLLIERMINLSDALESREYDRNAERAAAPYALPDILLALITAILAFTLIWIEKN